MDFERLRDTLGASFRGRLIDPSTAGPDADAFLLDHRRRWRGRTALIAQPEDTASVAALVRACAAAGTPVVTQGGNTGLTGGSVPDDSGSAVLLSMRRMNRIRAIDPIDQTMIAEAGCVLADVQQAARAHELLYPLSLASEGSCTIGGNLSTNAGGVQVLRYGNARELCLGLEVVTPAGDVWDGLRGLRKDNTGYDLRDLYIGAEGTLGIITAAVLKLFPQPRGHAVALVAVPSPRHALQLLHALRARLDTALTAFELMSDVCIVLVERHVPGTRQPFSPRSPWLVLVEAVSHDSDDDARARLEAAVAQALDDGHATDAAIAQSIAQAGAFRALREHISEAQAAEGKNIKHDISVPVSRIGDFLDANDAALLARWPGLRLVTFGHLGDGNLHYNVSPPLARAGDPAFLALEPEINRITHDHVVAFGGSISAEHGLGVLRRDEAARYRAPVEHALMRSIKQALDPRDLMNPGRLLPGDAAGPLPEPFPHRSPA